MNQKRKGTALGYSIWNCLDKAHLRRGGKGEEGNKIAISLLSASSLKQIHTYQIKKKKNTEREKKITKEKNNELVKAYA